MKIIDISTLQLGQKPSLPLYDPVTGEMLLNKNNTVTAAIIQALREGSFNKVLAIGNDEEVKQLRRSVRFTKVPLLSIKADTVMGSDLYDLEGKFLIAKGTALSSSILTSLARRKIIEVFLHKEINHDTLQKVFKVHEAIEKDISIPKIPPTTFANEDLLQDPKAINSRSVELMARHMEMSGNMEVEFDQTKGLKRLIASNDPFTERNDHKKKQFVDIYSMLLKKTEKLFDMLDKERKVNSTMLTEMCDELINALIIDKELLLCSMFIPHFTENYLVKHALNTAIIAINIATAHGYGAQMVAEVGYGALLADIGMLEIPLAIRNKKEKLSSIEINELKRHTIYGMDRLQFLNSIPKTTALVAYQSHERLDGSGYPHRKRTHAIHDYSKIVAVADVYHAMISERPYKDDAILPYKAIEELLHMGNKNKLDRRFIRSLLAAISLFPVASWVKLNTDEVARVLKASEKHYTKPVVVILYDSNGMPCNPERIDLEQTYNREVVSAVKSLDPDIMVGF